MTSIYEPSLYKIRHRENRTYIQGHKLETIYDNNPRTPRNRQPRIQVYFHITHQLIPENLPHVISSFDGLQFEEQLEVFNQPLRSFDRGGNSGPAVKAMLSRLRAPLDLRPEFGQLVWCFGEERGFAYLRGLGNLVAMMRVAGEMFIRQEMDAAAAASPEQPPVKAFRFGFSIRKQTIVDEDLYSTLYDDADIGLYEDDEDEGDEEVDDGGFLAEEWLETVVHGGDGSDNNNLVCMICLEEVLSGTYIARLPCSHCFHNDCVLPWLKKKKTCPLCRFNFF